MAEKKPVTPAPATSTGTPGLFTRENYKWMIIGVVVMALGFILMSGGKSTDPTVFSDDQVYSFRRITLAPILILIGLGIEVFAIFRKPKN
jgi:hypothetical protein